MEIEELKEKLSSGIPGEMAALEERLEATGTDADVMRLDTFFCKR